MISFFIITKRIKYCDVESDTLDDHYQCSECDVGVVSYHVLRLLKENIPVKVIQLDSSEFSASIYICSCQLKINNVRIKFISCCTFWNNYVN